MVEFPYLGKIRGRRESNSLTNLDCTPEVGQVGLATVFNGYRATPWSPVLEDSVKGNE